MLKDKEEMDLDIHGLNVFGDIMLVLFVALLVTTTVSVQSQLIKNSAFGGSKGDEVPPIGLRIVVGPGEFIQADGERVEMDKLLVRAEKVPESKSVQVQIDLAGDPVTYHDVRYKLRKRGIGFIEAPPQKTTITKKGRQ